MTPTRSASMAASSRAWVIKEDGGPGLPPHLQELVPHQEPGLLVQGPEGLVEKDEPRLQDQGPGDADPLAHPPESWAG